MAEWSVVRCGADRIVLCEVVVLGADVQYDLRAYGNEKTEKLNIVKDRKLIYVAAATAAVYLILILWWHLRMPVGDLTVQNPGADNRPAGLERKADDVVVGEYFMSFKVSG